MGNNHGHSDSAGHHIVPAATYMKILWILLGLTALTVLCAKPVSGLHLGFMGAVVAFAIASTKAALVLAIFMGLKYDSKLNLAIFLAALFFVAVMFSFSIVDIYTRLKVMSPL